MKITIKTNKEIISREKVETIEIIRNTIYLTFEETAGGGQEVIKGMINSIKCER